MITESEIKRRMTFVLNELIMEKQVTIRLLGYLEAMLQVVGKLNVGQFDFIMIKDTRLYSNQELRKETYKEHIIRLTTEYLTEGGEG